MDLLQQLLHKLSHHLEIPLIPFLSNQEDNHHLEGLLLKLPSLIIDHHLDNPFLVEPLLHQEDNCLIEELQLPNHILDQYLDNPFLVEPQLSLEENHQEEHLNQSTGVLLQEALEAHLPVDHSGSQLLSLLVNPHLANQFLVDH